MMKRFINFFKSKKQVMPSEKPHQAFSEAFGRMLNYAREIRQGPYLINNDIWYN
jgi:hypothetical protein